jgi:hypothetical protein
MLCKSQDMPTLYIPNDATIHTIRNFLLKNSPFDNQAPARLVFHPRFVYVDPLALAMTAAWGAWCRRQGIEIQVENCGHQVNYAARMQLFKHLGVSFQAALHEHEETGTLLSG